ncbi:MAG: DoxX family protein [Burkholderiaceae bacterium]
MALDTAFFSTWQPRVLALLRIVTAYLFLTHGTAKLLGIPAVKMFEAGVPLMSMSGIAGLIEIVGGVLLLIGLFTRPTAFILSGEMAFAYFIGHASRGNTLVPMLNGGELAVLYCFVFLYFAVAGAGAWSVDAMRGRSVRPMVNP